RPGVGARVVFLVGQPPIARGRARRVAALAGWVVVLGLARARIAAGLHGVARILDRGYVRPYDTIHADIQHLLGDPLAFLAAVGWDTHERRHRRRNAARGGDLPPVQHVLQAVAQRPYVVRIVLHLEYHAVIRRGSDGERVADLATGEGNEGRLA